MSTGSATRLLRATNAAAPLAGRVVYAQVARVNGVAVGGDKGSLAGTHLRSQIVEWKPEQDLRLVARQPFFDARVDIPISGIGDMAEAAARCLDISAQTRGGESLLTLDFKPLSRNEVRMLSDDIRRDLAVLKRKCGSRTHVSDSIESLEVQLGHVEHRAAATVRPRDRVAAFLSHFVGHHAPAQKQGYVAADARLALALMRQVSTMVKNEVMIRRELPTN